MGYAFSSQFQPYSLGFAISACGLSVADHETTGVRAHTSREGQGTASSLPARGTVARSGFDLGVRLRVRGRRREYVRLCEVLVVFGERLARAA